MKRFLFLFLFFLISNTGFSQNWDLFVPSQKSLYSNYHGYEDIRIDSTKIKDDTTIMYFNSRIRNSSCYSESALKANFWGGYFLIPKTTYLTPNHTIFKCTRNELQVDFIFKHHAQLGDTWPIAQTNLYFKCESIVKGTVFGETDSLKYFNVYETGNSNPLNEYKFILSKNYGLIQFVSITQLAFSDTIGLQKSTLLGLRKNGINKGFVVPDFNDFFHLHAGDVLIWKHIVKDDDISTPDEIYYYKDSILKTVHTNDSVLYTYSRNINSKIEIDSIYYLRKEFDDYLIQNPSHYVMVDKEPISHYSYMGDTFFSHVIVEDIRITDSVSEMNFDWSGWGHDKNDCLDILVFDVGSFFSINSIVGITKRGAVGFGTTSHEVIGSIINGKHLGITSIPTSVSIEKNNQLRIYPNPANTTITINGDFKTNAQYKIINVQGQLVQEGILGTIIDIDSLKGGLYYLQLSDNSSISYAKFLKLAD